jgi:hypothetical protein
MLTPIEISKFVYSSKLNVNFFMWKGKEKNKRQWRKQMEIKKVDSCVGTQGEGWDLTNMDIIILTLVKDLTLC